MNYARTSPQPELWHVQVGSVVRTMTLDELDNAFQAGVIDERTMVSRAGERHWTTLSEAAGLDEPVYNQPSSIAPISTDVAPSHVVVPPAYPPPTFDTSFGTEERAVFRPNRNIGSAVAVLTTVALMAGAGFAFAKYGVGHLGTQVTALMKGRNADAMRGATVAAPPPPVAATPPPKAVETLPPPVQPISIDAPPPTAPEANAKPAKKKVRRVKAAAANSESSPTPKAGDPTERGNGQFDPLDGKIN